MNKRFFSDDSFWNQKVGGEAKIHPRSGEWIALLEKVDGNSGFYLNLNEWTVPVYEATADTPVCSIEKRLPHFESGYEYFFLNSKPYISDGHPVGHGEGFGEAVPIPPEAEPDCSNDAHIAVIDRERGMAWDMWAAQKKDDGTWWSCTGMKYDLYGSGVFNPTQFKIHNGESIHLYGPSRASGVPIIAGLIMHHEILAGRIEHKLAFASDCAGLLEHVFPPAVWTDGGTPGGIPEGAVLQLDPSLDLDSLGLGESEKVVARAMQEYGLVLVDVADGASLYGEGLWGHEGLSWDGLLSQEGLRGIPYSSFRVIEHGMSVEKGMVPMAHHNINRNYHFYTGVPHTDGTIPSGMERRIEPQNIEQGTAE
ncbi:hypothetical protein PDESU_05808 [Pontiella desulfatans]|uniref:Uncharacterized protein n=1 Tax=Pontiella desulfatans TaxID=2750659 RepID=A0A6C2UAQ5_PONDE|nr:hypothetical protein [Pontiella desulfatans]VGO17212.1 hypothetical protein PDESU_05808 [Pontiella desulfatans]